MYSENEERRRGDNCMMEKPLIDQTANQEVEGAGIGLFWRNGGFERKEVVEEVKKQFRLAGPLVCVSVLMFSLQLISLMFVGHLGKLALSAASMATSFATVTGFSLLMGLSSVLDTFCGQSYGAKQYHMLGIHMQRSMVVQLFTSVPLAIIWANTDHILKFVGQDPVISHEAGIYAKFLIPSIFGYGLLQSQVRFLQTQNDVIPMMLTSGFTTLLHLILCWVLVFKSELGSKGPALALGLSYWINFFLLALYIKFFPACKETWTGFSIEAFHNIPLFLKLAIPSAIMLCLENWSFEMMVLLSGLLPNPQTETSVLSISLNTAATVWMIPFGLSNAVSTRVSNELGAGHPNRARLAVCVVLITAITEGILTGLILILIRKKWGNAYSDDKEVVEYVGGMMPLLAMSNMLDGVQCVLSGTVRGCGWQKIGAYINLASYYIVGIPFALLLAFLLHFGGKGLWLGIICALIVQTVSLFIIIMRINWVQESKKAMGRVCDSALPVEILS